MEGVVDAERLTRQQASAEFAKQLSVVVESIQEEQTLRSAEDTELRRIIDAARAGLEEEQRRRESLDGIISRTSQDSIKRYEQEAKVRDVEISKMLQLISEESEKRQEGDRKLGRMVTALED